VTVTSFPGRYCLAGSSAEGFEQVAADAPLTKCDVLGNPFDEQLAPAQREPLALANLVGAIRQRSGGAIEAGDRRRDPARRRLPGPGRAHHRG
jgi:hypothetical protein